MSEFDALRRDVNRTEAVVERQMAKLALGMKAVCEYRDELELKLDIAVQELAEASNTSEVKVRTMLEAAWQQRQVAS